MITILRWFLLVLLGIFIINTLFLFSGVLNPLSGEAKFWITFVFATLLIVAVGFYRRVGELEEEVEKLKQEKSVLMYDSTKHTTEGEE